MYFPGNTAEQIAALAQRVSNLEGQNAFQNEQPQAQGQDLALYQCDYQNHSSLSRTATGYSLGSSIPSGVGQASRLQQVQADSDAANEARIASTTKTTVSTGSYRPGFYIVKFLDGSSAAEIVADSFYFESGFVVFTRNSNDQAEASYPAHTVGSIRR